MPLHKVDYRYFFESDLLFRLNTIHAVVLDLPMAAIYAGEESGLKIQRIWLRFLCKNTCNFLKRVFYDYFLRGFSIASLELLLSLFFLLFGIAFGMHGWATSIATGRPATTGTVMLAALPVILGVQLLLSFLAFDIAAVPWRPITPLLQPKRMMTNPQPCVQSETQCGDVDAMAAVQSEVAS